MIDLKLLKEKFDEALNKETKESLTEFINKQREMNNTGVVKVVIYVTVEYDETVKREMLQEVNSRFSTEWDNPKHYICQVTNKGKYGIILPSTKPELSLILDNE